MIRPKRNNKRLLDTRASTTVPAIALGTNTTKTGSRRRTRGRDTPPWHAWSRFIPKAGMVMATTVVCGSRNRAAIGAPITGKPMPVAPLTKAATTIPKAARACAGVNAAGVTHAGVKNHRNAVQPIGAPLVSESKHALVARFAHRSHLG